MGIDRTSKFAFVELHEQAERPRRPYIAPPGVLTAVAHRLRDAVSNTLKDSALLSEAAKRQLDIEYTSPDEIQAIIAKMYDAPPDVIASVKKVLGDQTQ